VLICYFLSLFFYSSFYPGVCLLHSITLWLLLGKTPGRRNDQGLFILIITFYFLFVDAGRNLAIGSNRNMEFIFNNETDSLACEPHLLNISCTILLPVFDCTRNGCLASAYCCEVISCGKTHASYSIRNSMKGESKSLIVIYFLPHYSYCAGQCYIFTSPTIGAGYNLLPPGREFQQCSCCMKIEVLMPRPIKSR